ncbi:MAG: laccase domain protein [Gammaproteobacteria bacterium]|nr:MAG: laccase domain protein [Gammaproteobacteria bacterium]
MAADRFEGALLYPGWPAPAAVRAVTTTRRPPPGGDPARPFNLSTRLDPAATAARARLVEALALPGEPAWLEQVHGATVLDLDRDPAPPRRADAAFTRRPGVVCVVLTADCLPVLLCRRDAGAVAAVHAGWRGLAAGVIEAAVAALDAPPETLLAWLGPAIGADHYEVDTPVYRAVGAGPWFTPTRTGHWRLDLYAAARARLAALGVTAVWGGGHCTWRDADRFFSHRREGGVGRMASLVWIDPEAG